MDWVTGWAGLILGFSGLIFVHELGHFVLAKWNGVRVYVFSLGMGPYLLSYSYRGTMYVLSLIPIGGYVKLAGQDDMNVNLAPSQDKTDYRNKRPGQKAAILAAGAIFNLLFAIAAFSLCYTAGMYIVPPRIGNIAPDKPLAKAIVYQTEKPANLQPGDLIIAVNRVPVKTFLEAQLQISCTAANEDLWLQVLRGPTGSGKVEDVIVKTRTDKRLGASSIGLENYFEKARLPLGFTAEDTVGLFEVIAGKPAAAAGLMKGDEVLRITDLGDAAHPKVKNIVEAEDFINAVRGSDGHKLKLDVRRDGKELPIEVAPVQDKDADGFAIGVKPDERRRVADIDHGSEAYIAGLREGNYVIRFEPDQPNEKVWKSGTLLWKKNWDEKEKPQKMRLTVPSSDDSTALVFVQRRVGVEFYSDSPGAAIATAWDDTIRLSGTVFGVMRGLFTGDVSHKALSGPAGIGGLMYTVAHNQTFFNFLWFLGFISLNLGLLQFVPIPLLDGWHLLMVAIEKIKGSPVAPKIQEAFQYVGIFIVGGLLLLATYNDISRFIFGV
ncbi:MAG TPA: RIP metalloprotease RseP [Planctomycetota bacterium]|jgi:regulator of sigma E protease